MIETLLLIYVSILILAILLVLLIPKNRSPIFSIFDVPMILIIICWKYYAAIGLILLILYLCGKYLKIF